MIELEIPFLFPTLNKIERMDRGSKIPFRKIRLIKDWQRRIHQAFLVKGYNKDELPYKKALVEIERHTPQQPDYDNMAGGAKRLIDCLTTPVMQAKGYIRNKYGLGFIIDDSPKYIESKYIWIKTSPRKIKTVIRITPIELEIDSAITD